MQNSNENNIDGIITGLARRARVRRQLARLKSTVQASVHQHSWRAVLVFAGLSATMLLFIASLATVEKGQTARKQILGAATSGIDELLVGKDELLSRNYQEASGRLGKAADDFQNTRRLVEEATSGLAAVLRALPQGRDLEQALTGAELAVSALGKFSEIALELERTRLRWDPVSNSSDQKFFMDTLALRDKLTELHEQLSHSVTLLAGVRQTRVPENYRDQFLTGLAQLRLASATVEQTVEAQRLLVGLLGGKAKTYLMIFQNNNEARATGGFIGTYGLLGFSNGKMQILKIETIYNPDGQLAERIAAPGPLRKQATQTWGMRDANWFADFPQSARKLLEFLEKTTGVLADGVISFTPDVFEKLLAITGPVPMPEYDEILTSDNFREVAQRRTSYDYDRKLNQPKKFLEDFAPLLLNKLAELDQARWFDLMKIMKDSVRQKHLSVFSLDAEIQTSALKLGLGGEIRQTQNDYLAIVHSNVGGGKTDQGIEQKVSKRINIDISGKTTIKLDITRTHRGYTEKYFPKNIDFMRVFVPAGSRLLSATGFADAELLPSTLDEAKTDPDLAVWDSSFTRDPRNKIFIGREAGYTVFAGWLELSPDEAKTIELQYELPQPVRNTYSQLLQKQGGARPYNLELIIRLPRLAAFVYPDDFTVRGNELYLSNTVDSDQFAGVVLE